jgi:glycosyltransferase involved in cell wall biosynthesis
MKILIIDNYYPEFLECVEKGIIKERILDYEKIKNAIYCYKFGTSDYYSKNLRFLGEEADDLIVNSKLLQKSWAQSNSKCLNRVNFILEKIPKIGNYLNIIGNPLIMIEQIKKYKPDVVYVQCIGAIHPIITKIIKKNCKLLVGQIASKLPPDRYFKNYDLILSSLPNIVAKVKTLGMNSEYFPIGFEEDVLNKITITAEKYAVTHVGGYGPIHNQRNKVLEYVAQKIPIDFWGYGAKNLAKNSHILKKFHGEAWGLDMYNILANSKITLTGHIDEVAGDFANNMTLFEATGCGALLITDYKKNLHELFDLEKEIVTYKSPEEMVEKIQYYLTHEEERKKIASAGQKRTLLEHTYKKRMERLKFILEHYLNKNY